MHIYNHILRRCILSAVACVIALALPFSFTPISHAVPVSFGTEQPNKIKSSDTPNKPSIIDDSASNKDAGGLSVSILSLSPEILTDQSKLTITGTITNKSNLDISNIALSLSIDGQTPVGIEGIQQFFNGSLGPGVPIYWKNLDGVLKPGENKNFSATVERDSLPLQNSEDWGPRGITAHAYSNGATQNFGYDRTLLIWNPENITQKTRISAAIPWTDPHTPKDDASWDNLHNIVAHPGVTVATTPHAVISSDADTTLPATAPSAPSVSPLSASPTPKKEPDSVSPSAQYGQTHDGKQDNTDKSVHENQILASASEVIGLPLWDANIGILAAHSRTSSLRDLALASRSQAVTLKGKTAVSALRATAAQRKPPRLENSPHTPKADESASSTAMPSSSPQSEGHKPTERAMSRATAATFDHGPHLHLRSDVVWTSSSTFTTSLLKSLPGEIFIAPPGFLAPNNDVSFTPNAHVEVDSLTGKITSEHHEETRTVITPEQTLSELLSFEPSSPEEQLNLNQTLRAVGAIITRQLPSVSRTIFVAASRNTEITDSLNKRLSALLDNEWVDPISFSEVVNAPTSPLQRAAVPSNSETTDPVEGDFADALKAQGEIEPVINALVDPHAVNDELALQNFRLISFSLKEGKRSSCIQQLQDYINSVRNSVQSEGSATVNLINHSVNFPVRVRNSLPSDIVVNVTLNPSDRRMKAQTVKGTTIPANSTTSVDVPVEAVGSGNIQVVNVVSTETGFVLDNSTSIDVRLRAQWEDTGTLVVLIILVSALGWNIVKKIMNRKNAASEKGAA